MTFFLLLLHAWGDIPVLPNVTPTGKPRKNPWKSSDIDYVTTSSYYTASGHLFLGRGVVFILESAASVLS